MEIKILQPPIAVAFLDLNGFKKCLSDTMDFEKAVKSNLEVEYISEEAESEEMIKKIIYYASNWQIFLHILPKLSLEYVEFKVMKIEVKGFTAYDPGVVQPAAGVFKLKDKRMDHTYYVPLFTCNQRYDKQIEALLGMNLIDLGDKDWTIELSAEEFGR